ncbi:MAG: hypothetical protein JW844_04030 [Candidatus Omnitrophica bacterium]|nr:hypothetical protein [Candidatus Omnitrophota bacterium]
MFGEGLDYMEPIDILMAAINRGVVVIGIFLFLMGVGLLFAPKAVIWIGKKLNRAVSTERIEHFLERPRSVDELVLKFRLLFGIISLAIGGWILLHCYLILTIG